jgi:hypothetical protein
LFATPSVAFLQELQTDRVAFGDVVHAPPEVALKSKHWAANAKKQQQQQQQQEQKQQQASQQPGSHKQQQKQRPPKQQAPQVSCVAKTPHITPCRSSAFTFYSALLGHSS